MRKLFSATFIFILSTLSFAQNSSSNSSETSATPPTSAQSPTDFVQTVTTLDQEAHTQLTAQVNQILRQQAGSTEESSAGNEAAPSHPAPTPAAAPAAPAAATPASTSATPPPYTGFRDEGPPPSIDTQTSGSSSSQLNPY